jgi:hypothetical protein
VSSWTPEIGLSGPSSENKVGASQKEILESALGQLWAIYFPTGLDSPFRPIVPKILSGEASTGNFFCPFLIFSSPFD